MRPTPTRSASSSPAISDRVNSRVRTNLLLRASGIEVVRFFGFGNETPRIDSDFFYRVPQKQYLIQPSVGFPVGAAAASRWARR